MTCDISHSTSVRHLFNEKKEAKHSLEVGAQRFLEKLHLQFQQYKFLEMVHREWVFHDSVER